MKSQKEIANKMKEAQKTNDSSRKEDDVKNNSDNEDKSDNSDDDDDDDFRCKEAIRYNKLQQKKKVQLPNINLDEYVRKYNSYFIVRYGYFW